MSDERTDGVCIDLAAVESVGDLHRALATALDLPPDVAPTWEAFWERVTGDRPLPEAILLRGLDHVEAALPDDAQRFLELLGEYNNVPDGPRCAVGVSDDYRCSMYFLLFEAVPTVDAEFDDAKGALICCWVKTESAREAHRVARDHIEASGWLIVKQEEITPAVREDYDDDTTGLPYYEQACIDGTVFVFHTWSSEDGDEDDDDDDADDVSVPGGGGRSDRGS